jgi:NADPH2:quinone reductase
VKAALYERTGPAAEVLRVTEIDRPDPGPGQVRVRVHASGINPTDVKSRSGAVPRPIDGYQIPHHDGAGVIDAVGSGVDRGRVGEQVWLWLAAHRSRYGTAAQWTVVPDRHAVTMPDGVSMELGASLGVPGITAHRCVFADGPVSGSTLLVAGGAGAVGHFSIQLGNWGGAGTVISTAGGPESARLASEAGADHVVRYTDDDAADQIKAVADPVDRVVEVAINKNLQLDLAVSRADTVVMSYAADGPDPVLPVRACMSANIVLRFMLLYTLPDAAVDHALTDITAALTAKALTELPVHRFALDDIAAAHEAVESGVRGKVLVIPD